MSVSVYFSNSVISPFGLSCPFHWSQYAVSPHVSIKNPHSTVQSALRLQCTHFCQIFIIISPRLMTTAHAFLSKNLLCHKGPNLRYSGLVLERQTLWHYRKGIEYSNCESGDLIRYRATGCRMGDSKYCSNWERSVPKSYLAYQARGVGFSENEESNRVYVNFQKT